ncbi:M48 family metalloprotease [Metabacillus litoralis]|uniref:M48 family metalloprotease n=1 Tax=Metabacillus litoralis TaxID=152268 RepID=A0A5C6W5I0_9BACI|nr:M56 family metallopeptidase [Metabacillus litoralis]TXC93051.1 M48 family metalloprotease [Metabacillus litoralis]
MIPSLIEVIVYILIGCFIQLSGALIGKYYKKLGIATELFLGISAIGYVFYAHPFLNSFIYLALLSSSYFTLITLTSGRKKYEEIIIEINNLQVEEIELQRDLRRILLDITISLMVFFFAILFLVLGPNESPLKFFIIISLFTVIAEMVKRVFTYFQVRVFYEQQNNTLFIVSKYDSRRFTLEDCTLAQVESTVDVLKLHPFLTLFMTNTDFTTSLHKVLKLTLPGATIYLSIKELNKFKDILKENSQLEEHEQIKVLPFYHKKNIKRLSGKLYFAATVKGVSAYSGVLLLLYYLKAPPLLMIAVVLLYWLLNLYISDRVLKVAMDAKKLDNHEIIDLANKMCKRAGVKNVEIYEAESLEFNGLATGMNIGRAMITFTSSTLKLPLHVIEGILAHELIHVKKRDVMWGQIWRAVYLSMLLIFVLTIQKHVTNIDDYKIPLFFAIWFMMIFYPIYQSFFLQWMEVRADHLASTLVDNGNAQMAESLRILSIEQDKALNKSISYRLSGAEEKKEASSLERDSWLWRFIEFQFMAHPPMYWRVQSLIKNDEGWGKLILKRWATDRIKESFTK